MFPFAIHVVVFIPHLISLFDEMGNNTFIVNKKIIYFPLANKYFPSFLYRHRRFCATVFMRVVPLMLNCWWHELLLYIFICWNTLKWLHHTAGVYRQLYTIIIVFAFNLSSFAHSQPNVWIRIREYELWCAHIYFMFNLSHCDERLSRHLLICIV